MAPVAVSQNLLSVALPVRNGENFLAEALDSILAQTMADFVLHIADNASNDGTPDILADYAARDARIRVSRSAALIPQPVNVGRAVSLATTPWVKLFCHDDLMRPDCLEQVLAAVRAVDGGRVALICNGERYLYGSHLSKPAEGGTLRTYAGAEAIARHLWQLHRPLPFPALTTATVRRDALAAAGGFDARYLYFDRFAWLELLTRFDYAVLPDPLTVNRIHGAQVAIQARASLREVADTREFMPQFVSRHGAALGMTAKDRLRVRLIAAALAARAVSGQLAARRWGSAVATFARAPLVYWPVLPALIARAWRQEHRRAQDLAGTVPREMLYPG